MDVKQPKCTACGSPLNNITDNATVIQCEYCGSTVVVENANSLKEVEIDRSRELENLWQRLSEAVEANSIQNISRYASQILQIVPNDYRAKYYFAYAENRLKQHHYLKQFYTVPPKATTHGEIDEIVDHINRYSALRDHSLVMNYLNNLSTPKVTQHIENYREWFEHRRQKEEQYDAFPRDVFVCHRSTDQAIADKIVQSLEEDGNKCWIASRNLRPDDSENYWRNIEQAIKDCKIFLVISSMDAMLSDDVKKELQIARRLGKPSLQIKIDASKPTSLFKDFFDGNSWINAQDSLNSALETLKKRVYQQIHDLLHKDYKTQAEESLENEIKKETALNNDGQRSQPATVLSDDKKLKNLLNKVQIDIENKYFEDAKKDIEKALYLDARNGYVWWFRLLSEFHVQNEAEMIKHDAINDSRNFINAKKFADESLRRKIEILESRFKEKRKAIKAREEEMEKERQENIRKEKERKRLEEKRAEEQENLRKKKMQRQKETVVSDYDQMLKDAIDNFSKTHEEKNTQMLQEIETFENMRHPMENMFKSKKTIVGAAFIYIVSHLLMLIAFDPSTFFTYAAVLNLGGFLIWPTILVL